MIKLGVVVAVVEMTSKISKIITVLAGKTIQMPPIQQQKTNRMIISTTTLNNKCSMPKKEK